MVLYSKLNEGGNPMLKIVGWFLKRLVFASLYGSATESDRKALDMNTRKHAKVLLQCLLVIPGTVLAVMHGGETTRDIIMYVSIAAQIAGLAWFMISFASLPERHGIAAMAITATMFSSFVSGVYSLTVLSAMTAPWALLTIVPIFLWLYKAAALYDSADLLKIGKDETELLAARATIQLKDMLILMAKSLGINIED